MNHNSTLHARVAARNRVNAEANRQSVLLLNVFKSFLGKKVFKQTGELTEAVKNALPDSAPGIHRWFEWSRHTKSVRFHLRANETFRERNYDAEQTIYVGTTSEGVLALVEETPVEYLTDFKAERVEELRKIAEDKREEARQAENACHPFGLNE